MEEDKPSCDFDIQVIKFLTVFSCFAVCGFCQQLEHTEFLTLKIVRADIKYFSAVIPIHDGASLLLQVHVQFTIIKFFNCNTICSWSVNIHSSCGEDLELLCASGVLSSI